MRVIKNDGFSLIEVLVAAFILFLVLGTVTLTYTGAVKSTLSATQATHLHGYTPLIVEDIKFAIQSGEKEGSGRFLETNYRWTTTLEESKEIVGFLNSNTGEKIMSGRTAFLWSVKLVTTYQQRDVETEFLAVSWSE